MKGQTISFRTKWRTRTSYQRWQEVVEEEEENLCVPVDAVGLVVALEVARQRAGVPVVADEYDILP